MELTRRRNSPHGAQTHWGQLNVPGQDYALGLGGVFAVEDGCIRRWAGAGGLVLNWASDEVLPRSNRIAGFTAAKIVD